MEVTHISFEQAIHPTTILFLLMLVDRC